MAFCGEVIVLLPHRVSLIVIKKEKMSKVGVKTKR